MRWAKLGAQRTQQEWVLRDHLLTKDSELLHPRGVLGTRAAVGNSRSISDPARGVVALHRSPDSVLFAASGRTHEQGASSEVSPGLLPIVCGEFKLSTLLLSQLLHLWENFEPKCCRKPWRSFQSHLFAVEWECCSLRGA